MRVITLLFAAVLLIFAGLTIPEYMPEKADVVVIGAGAAGMQAAIESMEYTDSVVLLEKMAYPGGNSARATAGFNAALSEEDVPLFEAETAAAGQNGGSPELIRVMVTESSDALQRLRRMGADLSDTGLLAGHSVARTFRPSGGASVGGEITSVLYREIAGRNVDIRVENRALEIQRTDKGYLVLVENKTGRVYSIKAASVVIATGGFGGSAEMVVRYNPELKGFNTTNSVGAAGDYIGLTEQLPVQIVHLDDIQTHPTVEPDFGILITEALRGNGGILINSSGRRFTDEMAFREVLSRSILEQKEGYAWLVFDREVRSSLKSSEYYFKMQLVTEAASLGSLAEKLSVSRRALIETIEEWNGYAAAGKDLSYGRKDLSRLLENPPWYAIKVAPGVHYCMGGLAIDEGARVLDQNGNPIEGLYSAGEATGGIHGRDRLGGNSLTDALVFGRIAGREAALWALGKN